MEGGIVKSGEEYEGSDDLRQENENAHAVRLLPPTSVAPPTQSTSENPDKGKRLIEEEAPAAKSYKCMYCPKTFSRSQGLGAHINRHRQERQEQLDIALNLVKEVPFQSNFRNIGSPSEIQLQFAGTPTLADPSTPEFKSMADFSNIQE